MLSQAYSWSGSLRFKVARPDTFELSSNAAQRELFATVASSREATGESARRC